MKGSRIIDNTYNIYYKLSTKNKESIEINMAVVKKSFLSNLLGPDTYDTLNNYAKKIV